ncbi:hypothetical protein FDK22_00965 [Arcobacter arenosus]|uniref:Phosphate-starvation-inducible E n=1 Tax=Arcobacter arenosus TaxID=2576037 RepID=A0A5R8Y5D7_9BACT|nr:hypothetical protein FDK22_00965 [Arcobacter arenosus]
MKSLISTNKFYVELSLASIIFAVALFMDRLMDAIIYMLYFVIVLEITRAVVNYIREERVILTTLVDAFVILALRELIVNVVKINDKNIDSWNALFTSPNNFNIMVISGVIIFLLFVRYLVVKTSHRCILGKNKPCEFDD